MNPYLRDFIQFCFSTSGRRYTPSDARLIIQDEVSRNLEYGQAISDILLSNIKVRSVARSMFTLDMGIANESIREWMNREHRRATEDTGAELVVILDELPADKRRTTDITGDIIKVLRTPGEMDWLSQRISELTSNQLPMFTADSDRKLIGLYDKVPPAYHYILYYISRLVTPLFVSPIFRGDNSNPMLTLQTALLLTSKTTTPFPAQQYIENRLFAPNVEYKLRAEEISIVRQICLKLPTTRWLLLPSSSQPSKDIVPFQPKPVAVDSSAPMDTQDPEEEQPDPSVKLEPIEIRGARPTIESVGEEDVFEPLRTSKVRSSPPPAQRVANKSLRRSSLNTLAVQTKISEEQIVFILLQLQQKIRASAPKLSSHMQILHDTLGTLIDQQQISPRDKVSSQKLIDGLRTVWNEQNKLSIDREREVIQALVKLLRFG